MINLNKDYLKQILILKRDFNVVNTANTIVGFGKDLDVNTSVIYDLALNDVYLNIDNKKYYLSEDVAERVCGMYE